MKRLPCWMAVLALGSVWAVAQEQNPPSGDRPEARHHMMIERGGGPPGGMPGLPGLGGDWWRNSEIAQAINLKEEQHKQLNQILASHRESLITMRGRVENEEGKLHDLLDQDQPQQDQVLAEIGKLQEARNALEKEFTLMSLSFRGVLTPDQWKQLQSFTTRERGDKMMRFRTHGMGRDLPPQGPPPPTQK